MSSQALEVRVGWYGLGSMGLGMATNLQSHFKKIGALPLLYSNRTMSKGKPLQALGAQPEPDFRALVRNCDIIFTMISNDAVLTQLVDEAIAEGSLQNKLMIDTSTVHPNTSSSVAAKLRNHGASFIESPVFGASPVAAAGKLIFAMAGPKDEIERVRPLIQDVMGRQIMVCGEDVERSALLKITGNIMVIGLMELISEVQVFAEKTGLGTDQAEAFIGSMFGPTAESYSKRLTSGSYAPPLDQNPGFNVSLSIKDSKHALSIANSLDMRLPAIETALGHMLNARNFAGDHLDSSSMYGIIRAESGLSFWSDKSRRGT